MAIDSTGVTSIFIDDKDSATTDPYAQFLDGAILDMSFSGTPAVGGTWTLMELENNDIEDLGLELASGDAAAGWSFNVDNTGANGLLTATYVIPEPATLGMIAAMGGGILFIRRRFMI
jgi:hypothetical protein